MVVRGEEGRGGEGRETIAIADMLFIIILIYYLERTVFILSSHHFRSTFILKKTETCFSK